MRSVGPVSRFVSDWCRVRGSRESTARAARCVPLRPEGHVTRSPAGGKTAHSASKSGRPAMCVVQRARDSRARVGRIARLLEEEEKERERKVGRGQAYETGGKERKEATKTMRRKLDGVREKADEGGKANESG